MEKVEVIKNDALINIKISALFYKDVQDALNYLTTSVELSDVGSLLDKINNDAPDSDFNDWEKTVRTVMILCSEIETRAREQQFVEMVDIPESNESDSQ